LSSESITAEKPPPAFLHIQPTGSSGEKDVMETWMLRHPGTGLSTGMAGEIVGDDENVPGGIVGFDVLEQLNVVRRVA
jgi:hypothetical protein